MQPDTTPDTVVDSVVDIKTLTIGARQEAFLNDYRAIASKWGIDFQPAYRVVDLFAIQAQGTQLEGVKEDADKADAEDKG